MFVNREASGKEKERSSVGEFDMTGYLQYSHCARGAEECLTRLCCGTHSSAVTRVLQGASQGLWTNLVSMHQTKS
jgi:hypothetical protein